MELMFGPNNEEQKRIFKLSEKGYTIEQIKKILEIDKYFTEKGIGIPNEFIDLVLGKNMTYNEILIRNISLFLDSTNNPTFGRVAERLRCNSVEDYFLYILSARSLDKFCDSYKISDHENKSINYQRDENGYIVLEIGDYLATGINEANGSRYGAWYLLSNGTRVFIKNIVNPREAYAEMVAEELADQMGIAHARYELVKVGNMTKIASINFLKTYEELIHGYNILTDSKIKDISIICPMICRELKRAFPHLTEDEIKKIEEDFLKIAIFDKVVLNWDRNPGNWGVIVSPDRKVRLAPEFDNNHALDWHERDCKKEMTVGKSNNIDALLDYCLERFSNRDELLSFVKTCINNVSPKNAFENILKKKGISIPQSDRDEMEQIVLYLSGTSINTMKNWLEKQKNMSSRSDAEERI